MGRLEVAQAVVVIASKVSKQYVQSNPKRHPKQYDQGMS